MYTDQEDTTTRKTAGSVSAEREVPIASYEWQRERFLLFDPSLRENLPSRLIIFKIQLQVAGLG